ncbi:ABC transporter permease [Aquimarina sp. 2201CG5-10]|uniref:ABC transporter permease n=1 Tax=Aquimarina callyspongiae TaxID=3098150 RepID=UPI002AB35A2A|nr:ABC transporter permease [Aquimarina sp. 2201CG5-10]MDY8137526.1 ABC transporter permease [Aquimarina sp. 2201CG5-10]
MIRNYFKIAWRNIVKEKMFTAIKIGGFAIGITACLLISLFIRDELSYDQHYKNTDRIYRVVAEYKVNGEELKSVHFQLPFADALASDYPEILKAGKSNPSELFGAGARAFNIQGKDQSIFEEGFIYANQELLDILEIPILQGDAATALKKPFSIVISKSKADKYFPNGDAIGKTLVLDNDTSKTYMITGVMDKPLGKSHFEYDFLMEIEDENMSWTNNNYFTYVLVDEKADIQQLEKKMLSVIDKYIIPAYGSRGRSKEFMDVMKTSKLTLQPISDIHLKSTVNMNDGLKHGDLRFVWLFAAIAIFILLLACINFINLSTAKSANRAKEVGLRKTIGAFRKNLITQFITESVVFSIISFILGVALAWLLLPAFNSIAAKELMIPLGQWWFLPLIFIASLLIGVIAGLYPAFYLSAFKPVSVLKGNLRTGSKSGKLRSGLVIFQFTTSIILIIGTLIIYQQMNYILNKKLGYNKEQVLIIQGTNTLGNKVATFKNRLKQIPDVKQVSVSDYLPVDGTKQNGNTFQKVGDKNLNKSVPGQIWRVDHDYVKTLGLTITKGRDFSTEFASDSINSILINKTMAKSLGLKDPVGKQISNGENWTIIGVLEDFHFKSLKEDITPLTLVVGNSPGMISVKMDTDEVSNVLGSITTVWDNMMPNQSFRYTFLDQKFANMHDDVQRMGVIFNSFAMFALLVACLGLFALSAFMTEQRKKEISIRLVLGASFKSIYKILTVNFLKLVAISILIAVPIGWYLMQKWLEDFVYRIDMNWQVFAASGLLVLIIAVLTVSYQSIGAILVKPIKSLRTE